MDWPRPAGALQQATQGADQQTSSPADAHVRRLSHLDPKHAYIPRVRSHAERTLISFVRSGREWSPLWTAPQGQGVGPVFARSDRSRRQRSIGTDERQVIGRGQSLARARRSGAVRTDEHEPRLGGSAVARHEQLRSDLTNETTGPPDGPARARKRFGCQRICEAGIECLR